MRIGLIGYGKMGKAIEQIALERKHSISWKVDVNNPLEDQNLNDVDAMIEFTQPGSVLAHIDFAFKANIPIVVGTTGWNQHLNQIETNCKDLNATLLHASNFSIGVNVFFEMNKKLAQLMNVSSDYQAAIEEIHHTEKLDAPSGTAISLANDLIMNSDNYLSWICGENEEPDVNDKQLPVTSYRLPNVPGTHTVTYTSSIDQIKISHEAFNRKGFALGAVLAAEWLLDKKGVFTMKDVLSFNN